MKKISAFLLAVLMIFSLCACNKNSGQEIPQTSSAADSSPEFVEKGNGATSFYFTVVFDDGKESHYKIKTDKTTVGEALQELGIVSGEEGPYGLYVTCVDGETHKYEDDGKFWAFYDGENMSSTGVDKTQIKADGNYSLKVQAG